MCRWMAWSGQPAAAGRPAVQARARARRPEPALAHGRGDDERRRLRRRLVRHGRRARRVPQRRAGLGRRATCARWPAHIASPLVLAHVRATSGTAVQETNCHPFRHGRWLFVHNGVVADFPMLRRDLALAIAPERFAALQGSTDSEVLFLLALTFGLEDDPIGALERTIGLAEATARAHGLVPDVQASIGVSDGETLWAVRYSTVGAVADALRLGRRRGDPPPAPAPGAAGARRRPPHRLRAARRPPGRVARAPRGDGGDGAARGRGRAARVHADRRDGGRRAHPFRVMRAARRRGPLRA